MKKARLPRVTALFVISYKLLLGEILKEEQVREVQALCGLTVSLEPV